MRRIRREAVFLNVRFQVLTAASMMFRIVFWDVLPCKMAIILHGSTSQKTILNSVFKISQIYANVFFLGNSSICPILSMVCT
jgi:hypothetical protein